MFFWYEETGPFLTWMEVELYSSSSHIQRCEQESHAWKPNKLVHGKGGATCHSLATKIDSREDVDSLGAFEYPDDFETWDASLNRRCFSDVWKDMEGHHYGSLGKRATSKESVPIDRYICLILLITIMYNYIKLHKLRYDEAYCIQTLSNRTLNRNTKAHNVSMLDFIHFHIRNFTLPMGINPFDPRNTWHIQRSARPKGFMDIASLIGRVLHWWKAPRRTVKIMDMHIDSRCASVRVHGWEGFKAALRFPWCTFPIITVVQ